MAPISPTTSTSTSTSTSSGGRNHNPTVPPFPTISSLSLSSSSMEDHLPFHKANISGPTLSSLINRSTSSPSNTQGILFGNLSLQSPTLSDDSDSLSPPSSALIATITGFISTSTTTSNLSSLIQHHENNRHVIGWFSCRRRSTLRPSLREFSLTHSLSSSSSSPWQRIFLLVTTPLNDDTLQTVIHTHDYRLYQFISANCSLETTALDVMNIGPAFRGHYSAFSPNSSLPRLPCEVQGRSPMLEDDKEREIMYSKEKKRGANDHMDLETYVEGYELGKLSRLVGNDALGYTRGVEELYEKMLAKLDCLARQVETSSAKILEMVRFYRFFSVMLID